jgi:hypothetical protein
MRDDSAEPRLGELSAPPTFRINYRLIRALKQTVWPGLSTEIYVPFLHRGIELSIAERI